MGLVGEGDKKGSHWLFGQSGKVGLLAMPPFDFPIPGVDWLLSAKTVAAISHNPFDILAECDPNIMQPNVATLVFGSIMRQGSNRLVRGSPVAEDANPQI